MQPELATRPELTGLTEARWGPEARVGAVVVGGDYQGLGIVRSLGRHGIPVCVIDDEPSIARFSRYTTHYVRVAKLRDQDEAVETVLSVGDRLRLHGWVLYPTREESVAAFSSRRERLLESFRVPTPPWSSVRWAWDKRNTYRLAQTLGIGVPRTWYPRSESDLAAVDSDPPWAVKPAIKEHFIYATKAKAWMAIDRDQLHHLYRKAAALVADGEVMIQEFIPGGGSQQYAYCAFFKDGSAVGSMVTRRLRQHPHDFGRASTYVETVDESRVEELSRRFLTAIDYYGLVELEYKLDARDGDLKLLDVNARTWGYHVLGARAGVDFPLLLFQDQTGSAPDPVRAAAGIRWMRLLTDLPTALDGIRRGRLDWATYLRSLRACNVEAVFSISDPLPGLAELLLLPRLIASRGF